MLTKHIVIANPQPGWFATIFQILGRFPDDATGKKMIVRVSYTHDITLPFYRYPWTFDFRKEDTAY